MLLPIIVSFLLLPATLEMSKTKAFNGNSRNEQKTQALPSTLEMSRKHKLLPSTLEMSKTKAFTGNSRN
jgi:hypothetical protein